MRINEHIREFFLLSRWERIAVYSLLGIILCIVIFNLLLSSPELSQQEINDLARYDQLFDPAAEQPQKNTAKAHAGKSGNFLKHEKEIAAIDPNLASLDQLVAAGLPKSVAARLIRYRSTGAKFKNLADIKKIYGINDELIAKLSSAFIFSSDSTKDKTAFVRTPLDINLADSVSLVKLRGIGELTAGKIIRFRKALGGFYSLDQLKEVRGFSPENYALALPDLLLETPVTKININNVSAADLYRHPYFRNIARPLIAFREKHGAFKSIGDLKKCDLVTDEICAKIAPYINFTP